MSQTDKEFFKEMKQEFQELGTKVNRLFNDIVKGKDGEGEVSPKMDAYELNSTLVLELDLPGFEKADVRVQVVDGNLVVQGKRKRVQETETAYYRMRERRFGAFQREFSLPEGTDPSQIKARFNLGVLTITLPIAGPARNQNEVNID